VGVNESGMRASTGGSGCVRHSAALGCFGHDPGLWFGCSAVGVRRARLGGMKGLRCRGKRGAPACSQGWPSAGICGGPLSAPSCAPLPPARTGQQGSSRANMSRLNSLIRHSSVLLACTWLEMLLQRLPLLLFDFDVDVWTTSVLHLELRAQ
jgi:hypothetical protein